MGQNQSISHFRLKNDAVIKNLKSQKTYIFFILYLFARCLKLCRESSSLGLQVEEQPHLRQGWGRGGGTRRWFSQLLFRWCSRSSHFAVAQTNRMTKPNFSGAGNYDLAIGRGSTWLDTIPQFTFRKYFFLLVSWNMQFI